MTDLEYHFDDVLVQCPLCACRSFMLFESTVNRGATLQNQLCRKCGMVFLSPRMSADDLAGFYRSQYRMHDAENDKPSPRVVEQEQLRARYQVDLFATWGLMPQRFLDIGASTGQLLHLTSERFKCVSVGVEPGDLYRDHVEHGFVRYPGVAELINANEPPFDLIAMSHVLEHLPAPISFLQTLRERVLKADGMLFVEVPNLYGHSCFEPAHLYAFTCKTLTLMLQTAGFSVVETRSHSAPKDFGWRNISVLARSSRQATTRPRQFFIPAWVKFQRTVGLSGTRHWYGYLYQQAKKKLFNSDES
jgi:2-polyprenyl-3-methyl-5-hydroxy-6-metoxy-1,4-benzoquinol methylase